MPRTVIMLASALATSSAAFSMHMPPPATRPRVISPAISMMEQVPRPEGAPALPFRTALIAVLSIQAAFGLTSENEMAGLLTRLGDPTLDVNYLGTFLDAAFLAYGTNVLLSQAGVIKEDPSEMMASLNNMECQVKLNIGREPGTWMQKEWAASGARLSVPLTVRFSDEVVDLGFEGEEALNPGGGRYAKKLYCEGGSFVSAQGEVKVKTTGGAWATEPSGVPGASTLNFFVDIAEEAARNDVTLPAGRVYFSGATWDSKSSLPPGMMDGVINMPDGETAGIVEGPGGVCVLDKGSISIKANKPLNLWGALGDVMHILGRFSVASTVPATSATSSESAAATRDSSPVADAAVGDGAAAEQAPAEGMLDADQAELAALSAEIAKRQALLAEFEKKEQEGGK